MCFVQLGAKLLWVNVEQVFPLHGFLWCDFFWYTMPSSEVSLSETWLRGCNQCNEILTRSIPAIPRCCVNMVSFWPQHTQAETDCLCCILLTWVTLAGGISNLLSSEAPVRPCSLSISGVPYWRGPCEFEKSCMSAVGLRVATCVWKMVPRVVHIHLPCRLTRTGFSPVPLV